MATRPHKREIPPIPARTGNPTCIDQPRRTRTYEPQSHIKWLGLIFDSKLSFRQHVQHQASRGAAAAGCLRMLANTKGGLSHQNMRTLHNTCFLRITSVVERQKEPNKKDSKETKQMPQDDNSSLRHNTNTRHASRISVHIPLDYMKQRAAARLAARIDSITGPPTTGGWQT